MLKKQIARLLLRGMLGKFANSLHPLDRMLGDAVRLQLGKMPDDDFRKRLEQFYRESNPTQLAQEIRFDELRRLLDRPGSYKTGIRRLTGDQIVGGLGARLSPWQRRFSLLQQLHIRCDVLVLRRGEQVPPHGHNRVVSGFYLLEGQVACRHYDRVREDDGALLVRLALDLVHQPGGYTTNSEAHHNIHWLQGVAPQSYLFRTTVTNTPATPFNGHLTANERIYVDPVSSPPDAEGVIRARYVDEAEAKKLVLAPPVKETVTECERVGV